jgi:hypothetical protein
MRYYQRRDRLRDRNNRVDPDSESVARLVEKDETAAFVENYLDIAVIQNYQEERYSEPTTGPRACLTLDRSHIVGRNR